MRQQPLERVPGIANASHAAHHRRALLLPQGLLWLPIVHSLSLILKAVPESDAAGCFGSPLQGLPSSCGCCSTL